MWVSLASVQPPVQLAGSNSARTVRRLLALADVAAVESDHYLVGSAAKEILSAAADDLEFSSDSGRERARLVSPQLLSLLLLSWSELPVDHPGHRLWRPSGAAPFTTMEEFDARAAYMGASITAKPVSAWCVLLGCGADRGQHEVLYQWARTSSCCCGHSCTTVTADTSHTTLCTTPPYISPGTFPRPWHGLQR